jgi:serine protease AprX
MALNRWFIFFIGLFLFTNQVVEGQVRKYVVYLNNKGGGGNPYSLAQPQQFLSQKSIQRRINQNLALDSTDLPVSPSYVQVISNLGVSVLYRLRWLNALIVECSSSQQDAILNLPFVEDSRPLNSKQKGSAVKHRSKSGIQAIDYGPSDNQNVMIGIDSMHSWGFHGEGMTIAVMDAGFRNVNGHQAFLPLFQNNRILGVKDFVDRDSDVYLDHWHGAAVLSNIGGYLPGKIVGGAYNANFYLLRTEEDPTENEIECAYWVAGIEYADSVGADIVNSSLGYSTFDNSGLNYTYNTLDGNTAIASRAAAMAAGKGLVVVCSAGNEGNNTSWGGWITSPADARNILTVGSVNNLQVPSGFSGKGPTFDGRIKPDVVAQGGQAVIANVFTNEDITTSNGTSFSAPIVTGLVAGFWQAHPSLTALQVINHIKNSGNRASSPDNTVGWGIPGFVKAHILAGARPILSYPFDLVVFPNPSDNNQLFIEFLESNAVGPAKIRLVNSKGQIVIEDSVFFDLTHQQYNMALRGIAHGIYSFQLEMGGKKISRKVVLF